MLYSLCLRGAEGERRRLDEADVVARTFVDAVEVCEGSWREFEVGVEVVVLVLGDGEAVGGLEAFGGGCGVGVDIIVIVVVVVLVG